MPTPICLRSKQAMDTIGKLSETIPEIEAQLLNEGWTYQGEEELIAAEPTPKEKRKFKGCLAQSIVRSSSNLMLGSFKITCHFLFGNILLGFTSYFN